MQNASSPENCLFVNLDKLSIFDRKFYGLTILMLLFLPSTTNPLMLLLANDTTLPWN